MKVPGFMGRAVASLDIENEHNETFQDEQKAWAKDFRLYIFWSF